MKQIRTSVVSYVFYFTSARFLGGFFFGAQKMKAVRT